MLNKLVLQGRVCADLELKSTSGGHSVVSFTLACERDYKPEGGERESDFINCVLWNSSAEFAAKYFSKGDMMVVEGRVQTRNYEDSNGVKRKAVELVGDHVYFCGSKRNDDQKREKPVSEDGFMNIPDGVEDEGLPFN